MQIHFLLLFTLAASILAAPLAAPQWGAQQTVAVEDAIRRAGNALASLDTFFRQTRPSASEAGAFVNQALNLQARVVDELRAGTREVKLGGAINAAEAAKLADWVDALSNLYESAMRGWTNAKASVRSSGRKNMVLTSLLDLQDATNNLNDAVTAKLPSGLITATVGRRSKQRQAGAVDEAIKQMKTA
ncbi:hypothetical protein EJ06DRAFT_272416 [Trichodelitschia bisporula]|uniref:Cell wall protein n=1 Tax=Trichodelitschia bisporula TaxID=703511 RepID=A0A6G1I563_9PEZI|nr:hypothetical protein EJ06DRAFT_272416 [Trichodelitschia bisporula]